MNKPNVKPSSLQQADVQLGKWIFELNELRCGMNATADLGRKAKLANMIAEVLAESEEVFLDFKHSVPQ